MRWERAVPRLCDDYPGICLTTQEKAQKNLSQGKTLHITHTHITKSSKTHIINHQHITKSWKKTTHYKILINHPHITKSWKNNTLQNPQKHTHTSENTHPPTHTHITKSSKTHTSENTHPHTHIINHPHITKSWKKHPHITKSSKTHTS